tara:strand:+ start:1386 stop:1652 length:267 start_codon:yes stop_codon:yes gene_type:complete
MESNKTKFKVDIFQLPLDQKPKKVSKEIKEAMKGVISAKKMAKLKKDAVNCPVLKEERGFLECFVCKSHIRRVKGVVDCAGGSAELEV